MNKTLIRSFLVLSSMFFLRCYGGSDSTQGTSSSAAPRRPSLVDRAVSTVADLVRRNSNAASKKGDGFAFATEEEGKKWLAQTAAKGETLQASPKRTQQLSPTSDEQAPETATRIHGSVAGVSFHAPVSQAHRMPGVSSAPRFPVGSEPYITHHDGSENLFANNNQFRIAQQALDEIVKNKQAGVDYTDKEAGQILSFVGVMLYIVNQSREYNVFPQSIRHAQKEINEFVGALEASNNVILKKFAQAYTAGKTDIQEAQNPIAATAG